MIASTLGLRDLGMFVLGFFLLLRKSKILAVRLAHVTCIAGVWQLLIPKSKTDQQARGMVVPIPA